jgi:hypothetical protein
LCAGAISRFIRPESAATEVLLRKTRADHEDVREFETGVAAVNDILLLVQ